MKILFIFISTIVLFNFFEAESSLYHLEKFKANNSRIENHVAEHFTPSLATEVDMPAYPPADPRKRTNARKQPAGDAKCAKEIGAPVKCIAPLKGLIKSIIVGIDGPCPVTTMTEWPKEVQNIKETCLDKNVPAAKCADIFKIAENCKTAFASIVTAAGSSDGDCQKWIVDHFSVFDISQTENIRKISCLLGGYNDPYVGWVLQDDNIGKYCTNRKLGWVDFGSLEQCKVRCANADSNILSFRPTKTGFGTGMCACCNNPPFMAMSYNGVDSYTRADYSKCRNVACQSDSECGDGCKCKRRAGDLGSCIKKGGGGGCFPGNSVVLLSNGNRKEISDLQVGDSVQAVDDNGNLVFSPIILHLHRSSNEKGMFLNLRTSTGHSLTLSPQHLVYRKQKNAEQNDNEKNSTIQSFHPVFASTVEKGDSVLVQNNNEELISGVVVDVKEMMLEGLYSPLTSKGNIIVDDILASCYSDFDSHEIQHIGFAPFRWMYSLLKFVYPTELKNQNAGVSVSQDDEGVHWYGQGLHALSNIAFPWKMWD